MARSEAIEGDEEEEAFGEEVTKLQADGNVKTSFVDRMAQVREKRKRKRRGRSSATGNGSKRTTPSPTGDESKESFVLDDDSVSVASDRFRGHVEEVERFRLRASRLLPLVVGGSTTECLFQREPCRPQEMRR